MINLREMQEWLRGVGPSTPLVFSRRLDLKRIIEELETLRRVQAEQSKLIFQQESSFLWACAVLGDDVVMNVEERSLRFLEEACELVQATGLSRERAHALVDYVYERDIGKASQEIGGVMVTLYVLCVVLGHDALTCARDELARIEQPEVREKVRRRQTEKREALVTGEKVR